MLTCTIRAAPARRASSSLCSLDQPDGECDEGGGDEQRATSGELRADRGPGGLADGQMQEEAARAEPRLPRAERSHVSYTMIGPGREFCRP